MAVGGERSAQLVVVVDLAVAHQPDRLLDIVQGLAAACDVDDGQAPVAQGRLGIGEYALPVRTSMHQRTQHGAHIRAPGIKCTDDAGDTAHLFVSASLLDCPAKNRLVPFGAAVDEILLDRRLIVPAHVDTPL
jgi:hypothetical protein